MTLTAWAVTTGEAGMTTQARGLAAAVADVVMEKTVGARTLWPWRKSATTDDLAPPYPDIVVSCGRRAASQAVRVKRASGGRTVIVHVQDPRTDRAAFDLIVAMDHDRLAARGNVVKVATALHDLTADTLAAAGREWQGRFARLPRPLAGVIVGGDVRGRRFTPQDAADLIAKLVRLRAGGGLAVTPSRRTPQTVLDALTAAFAGDPGAWVWDRRGDNPYRAILALSDRLAVTGDSVSMISEAISTPLPVEVFDLAIPRYRAFVAGLVASGRVRRFAGDLAPPPAGEPVDATRTAAAAVRALLQTRTGVSG